MPGLDGKPLPGFQVHEHPIPLKIKSPFLGIQNVKYDNLMFLMPKMLEPSHHPFGVIEKVRDQNNQPPPLDPFGQMVQDPAHIRPPTGLQPVQFGQQGVQIAHHRLGG